MPREPAPQILFIRTDRLGETLLTLPAVTALHAACPHSRMTLLVHPELTGLLGAVPHMERVVGYPFVQTPVWWLRALRLAGWLRRHRFDIVMVSNPKKEFHLAAFLARIPTRVGYRRKWGGLLTHRVPDRKALGDRHEVEYNLDLLRALGVPAAIPPQPSLRFEEEHPQVRQLLQEMGVDLSQPLIAVHPWTSNPVKRWPLERYRMLIQRIVDRRLATVVVIGGPEERDAAGSVVFPHPAVASLVGRLTLPQLAALLQQVRLLVSNDSGPVHLAAWVQTKTLVLFGTSSAATGPTRWGPWGTGHTVIWKPSMDAITVEEVFEALQRQLASQ